MADIESDRATLEAWWADKLTRVDPILESNGIDALWWQYPAFGDVPKQDASDLDQSVRLILTTPQGSDPHRPTFSSGIWNYIDYPIARATPFVIRESTLAVETWEPRVVLNDITVLQYSPHGIASMQVSTEWTVAGTTETGATEASFG